MILELTDEQVAVVRALLKSALNFTTNQPSIGQAYTTCAAILAQIEAGGTATGWRPIAEAPEEWKDGRCLLYYAPARDDLPPLHGMVNYHPDAGWCVDELRQVSHLAMFQDAKCISVDAPEARTAFAADLACWCAIGTPCHADVLLRVANEGRE